jgi:hypothetical protein
MKLYTAHTRARRAPVLVREGFSWGALIFGPFWLLAHRAWIAGVLTLCVLVVIAVLAPPALAASLLLVLFWAIGVFGNDFRRWSLARHGYLLVHVVAAPGEDAALARLLERRPDLIPDAVGGVLA